MTEGARPETEDTEHWGQGRVEERSAQDGQHKSLKQWAHHTWRAQGEGRGHR